MAEQDTVAADVLAASARKWRDTLLSTRRVDRARAEEAVSEAYDRAGLKQPAGIIWCEGPIAIERSRKRFWYELDPGPSVKAQLFDQPLSRALRKVHGLPQPIYASVIQAFNVRRGTRGFLALTEAINHRAARVRWGARMLARLSPANWRRHASYTSFAASAWAPYDMRDILGVTEALRNIAAPRDDFVALEGLWKLAANAGWIVAHERLCWLSDRWTKITFDASDRLHCSDGAAVQFADGVDLFYWKNIELPDWLMDHRTRITPTLIDVQPSPMIRRCMIEMMTPAAYVATGAATRVASDQTGTLWAKQWSSLDIWAAVEVVNGTPGPDGRREHYFLQVPGHFRRAIDAVAWTYGIHPDIYATLARRT